MKSHTSKTTTELREMNGDRNACNARGKAILSAASCLDMMRTDKLTVRAVPERLDRRVKSLCLLNVIKHGILINTHKTKQATSCRVTCNRIPFFTRYCVFIQVMTQH